MGGWTQDLADNLGGTEAGTAVCLSIYLSYLSICVISSEIIHMYLIIYLSIYLSIHLTNFLSIYLIQIKAYQLLELLLNFSVQTFLPLI